MRNRLRNQQGVAAIDAVIALCIIAVLIGVMIPKYQRLAIEAQESALKFGLANIRLSIRLFNMLNHRNPNSLNELIEKNVLLPARAGNGPFTGPIFFDQKYLSGQALDAQGRLLDPFGNGYSYDAVRGEVRASTKGYEIW
jgi:competence protein ComGC